MADETPRVSASALVHADLRAAILEGTLAPGDRVPSERALAEAHAVNRHAVREALKRLEQAGLVRITQGGPTRVEDWRRSGGLELLLDLLGPTGDAGHPPVELARGVLELRASIGADAARATAERAPDDERRAVADRFAAAGAAADAHAGTGAVDQAHQAAWDALVDAGGNVAYRLALTSLVRALAAYPDLLELVRPSAGAGLRELGEAVAAGAGEDAARIARGLLSDDVRRLDTTGWTS